MDESTPNLATETARLVRRAREGDELAYEQLFTRVADRLLFFVEVRLGDKLRARVDPLDVLQETFLQGHRSFGSFEYRSEHAFTKWLFRIAENCLRGLSDYFAAKKRESDRCRERISRVLEVARNSVAGPATCAESSEERERLRRALAALDEESRHIVLLRYYQDRTVDEIARHTRISASTVKRRLAHATVQLGGLLRGGASIGGAD